jgi:DnaK suppressor protein
MTPTRMRAAKIRHPTQIAAADSRVAKTMISASSAWAAPYSRPAVSATAPVVTTAPIPCAKRFGGPGTKRGGPRRGRRSPPVSYPGEMSGDVDRLLAERQETLEAELAELTKPAGEVGAISFGKRVGDGTSIAVDRLTAVSAQEHLLAILDEVKRARQRLADGTYGVCEVCGQPISPERLEVRPWAARCIRHS